MKSKPNLNQAQVWICLCSQSCNNAIFSANIYTFLLSFAAYYKARGKMQQMVLWHVSLEIPGILAAGID
jgi:hypothetical protein